MLFGEAELGRDDVGRQRSGQVVDHFASSLRRNLVYELGHMKTDFVFKLLHRSGRELAGDKTALRLVAGVVFVDHGIARLDARART